MIFKPLDKGGHNFPDVITLKVNEKAGCEFELAN